MPRLRRFNQLKRPNVRQSWNKANLYNLSRIKTPSAERKTFFQQKWTAKSMLRAYHNPDVREGTWTRIFDRRLPAVVPMDHRYLAQHDGSEMAEGRGMGLMGSQKKPDSEQRSEDRGRRKGKSDIEKTPYMHMTFFPLERRLDTAIFRAMFASSTRQARQFVVHGWVKVNGKKMVYPGYQLNPGDLFSVDPERVMYATGAAKESVKTEGEEVAESAEENAEAEEEEVGESKSDEVADASSDAVPDSPAARADAKSALKKLLLDTKTVLDEAKDDLSGKRIRELRDFNRNVKKLMSQYRGVEESSLDQSIEEMRNSFAEILGKVPEGVDVPGEDSKKQAAAEAEETRKAKQDAARLADALERVRENPYDPSKPYATPWRPRDFMSAFAFIPRYLEVNQNICSAVYLRHPVARPGLAEVPTPYSAETMALAFNWYLRRR